MVDFGMKHGILRELNKRKCDVIVVPYNITAEEVLQLKPDGIMLSNGPGDPKDVPEAIEMIKGVLGKVPLFGICLGRNYSRWRAGRILKNEIRPQGSNHPVKELATGKVALTSQNHGYTVSSISKTELEVTHIAINDDTIEGLKHKTLPAFTVQYHPEASPGPEDANHLFDRFIEMIETTEKEGEAVCQNA